MNRYTLDSPASKDIRTNDPLPASRSAPEPEFISMDPNVVEKFSPHPLALVLTPWCTTAATPAAGRVDVPQLMYSAGWIKAPKLLMTSWVTTRTTDLACFHPSSKGPKVYVAEARAVDDLTGRLGSLQSP